VARNDTQRDLATLEAELKRLEAEYTMFFGGRLRRPPLETRARVAALITRYDRARITNTGDRFRFTTLQNRYVTLVELWDRGMRAREEGRGGPFTHHQPRTEKDALPMRVLHAAAFSDPQAETDKLHALYESLTTARREVGGPSITFDQFTEYVQQQVARLQSDGKGEVAFRVTVKDGQVDLTARALKGRQDA
jgi:hypothetical protein